MIVRNPEEVTDTARPISVSGAAAYLGVTPSSLRHHLVNAGHPPKVGENGRAYLTVTLADADEILQARRREAARVQELPGWSAAEVAARIGIQVATVHRLRELGKLPAIAVEGPGHRKWRWDPTTVRAYAQRVGRRVAE